METYHKVASEYLESIKDKLIAMDGITYCIGDDSAFCMHLMSTYSLPNDVSELMKNTDCISKKHGYDLVLQLNIVPEWHHMRIRNVNGHEMYELDTFCDPTCNECGVKLNGHSYWESEQGPGRMCVECYTLSTGWCRVYDPDMNFLDYVEFMHEESENSVCSGAIFYVNCNTGSLHYGKIMVTIADGHGRQRFDVLYRNVEHMMIDIHKWLKLVPSAFTHEELVQQYNYDQWFELNPESIPKDIALEGESCEVAQAREAAILNNFIDYSWYIKDAIKYGIIKEGDKLTNSIVLQNQHVKHTFQDPQAKLQEIADDFVKRQHMDMSDALVAANAELQRLQNTTVFPSYLPEQIRRNIKDSGVYDNVLYASFTVWQRVTYDLEFDWG